MLILSISSVLHWILWKLFLGFCILCVISVIYIFIGSAFSSKMRDKYMRF
jgi:hypothetical protein